MKKFSQLIPEQEDVAVMQPHEEVINVEREVPELIDPQIEEPAPEEEYPPETEMLEEPGEIPEYMLEDPRWVGYPDKKLQEEIYRTAAFGLIGIGNESILDVGCGRGDFGHYLKSTINPDIEYIGIDANPHMINAGRQKYPDLSLSTRQFDINDEDNGATYDWVTHITDLTVDYGFIGQTNQYDYLDAIIRKSLSKAKIGTVFILLNDSNRTDEYLHWNIGSVAQMLLFMGVRFAIDNTDFPNMYKLIIFKNPF